MGNTDSQYSSFILPGKPRACSLKQASKEQVLSPHSWWRGADLANGYRNRAAGRNGLSPHKGSQPYLSRHYDYVNKGTRGGASEPQQRPSSPRRCAGGGWDDCYSTTTYSQLGGEGNGLQVPQQGRTEGGSDALASRNSPKVLFSQDGSLRVEFTKTRCQPEEDNEEEEEVEEVEVDGVAPPRPNAPTDGGLRTSNGSSLSSEGSWYDSPWGTGGELNDNGFHHGNPAADTTSSSGYATFSSTASTHHNDSGNSGRLDTTCSSAASTGGGFGSGFDPRLHIHQYGSRGYLGNGYNTCSSGRTEDSGIGDSLVALQADHRELERIVSAPVSLSAHRSTPSLTNPFPLPASTLPPQFQEGPLAHHRASMASALDSAGTMPRECLDPAGTQYSSLTLPCRKATPVTAAPTNARKDSLKSRIRRLSDWTGSLSRKKRRLQVRERASGKIWFWRGGNAAAPAGRLFFMRVNSKQVVPSLSLHHGPLSIRTPCFPSIATGMFSANLI